MAIFAQPTQDENLVPGWNIQSVKGSAGNGYAQASARADAVTATEAEAAPVQSGAGAPLPVQDGVAAHNVLTNPGYADGSAPATIPAGDDTPAV